MDVSEIEEESFGRSLSSGVCVRITSDKFLLRPSFGGGVSSEGIFHRSSPNSQRVVKTTTNN